MSKNTATRVAAGRGGRADTEGSERDWVAEVAETWNQLAEAGKKHTGPELAEALAARWKMTAATASGLLQGFQRLVSYARGEMAEDTSALDEERWSVQAALGAVRPVLQARLQQRLDQADEQRPEVTCLGCGQRCQSQGRRERQWQSTVGPLTLRQRYGWCERCRQGRAPAQAEVGLPESALTAGLEEVTSLMATTVPHQMAVELVQKLLGVEVSAQAVKSSVARRAEQVIQGQDEEAREINEFEQRWGKSPPYITKQAPDRAIEVAYLEVDGVHVPIREAAPTAPVESPCHYPNLDI